MKQQRFHPQNANLAEIYGSQPFLEKYFWEPG